MNAVTTPKAWVCSWGHEWFAEATQIKCPYCSHGTPCTGTPSPKSASAGKKKKQEP